MTVVVDTSAAAKLYLDEPESDAVRREFRALVRDGQDLAISSIAVVEMRRLAVRIGENPEDVADTIGRFRVLKLTEIVLELAGRFSEPHLGTLDAIHLATALSVEASMIVTYDQRLAAAARAEGLAVVAPT